jgi:hypothetical protein
LVRVRLTGPVSDQDSAAALGQQVAKRLIEQVLAQGGKLDHLPAASK